MYKDCISENKYGFILLVNPIRLFYNIYCFCITKFKTEKRINIFWRWRGIFVVLLFMQVGSRQSRNCRWSRFITSNMILNPKRQCIAQHLASSFHLTVFVFKEVFWTRIFLFFFSFLLVYWCVILKQMKQGIISDHCIFTSKSNNLEINMRIWHIKVPCKHTVWY